MSSPNANNELDQFDDPFASSNIDMNNTGLEDMGDPDNGLPEEGNPFDKVAPIDSENPMGGIPEIDAGSSEKTKTEVRYKTPRPDYYLVLLFLSWAALLVIIGLFWLECHPSEYGEVPYKESSRPVVQSAG